LCEFRYREKEFSEKRDIKMNRKEFLTGMKESIPVGIGYFSVSFGFGALAIATGLDVFTATLISAVNLTSAGQFAGLQVIAALAPLLDMILCQLVINSRYALMSIALSQRMGPDISTFHRTIISFFNTDEVFAIAIKRKEPLSSAFMLGLGPLPIIGWTLGTLCGALAGSLLPLSVRTALSVALYGMFIAIVVPQTASERPKRFAALIAVALSCLFYFMPFLKENVSSGLSVVICTLISAGLCAFFFPLPEEKEAE
jgi:predicted branched-subunit amino acid permease